MYLLCSRHDTLYFCHITKQASSFLTFTVTSEIHINFIDEETEAQKS